MGPVVRLVRQDPELGELAVADLVGDLARLHVALRVVAGRLHRAEPAERAGGELRVARDRLHRDDERVAPEQRHEPRHAGGRDDDAPLERRVLEAERVEVADGLLPRPLDGRSSASRSRPSAGSAGRRRTADLDGVAAAGSSAGGGRASEPVSGSHLQARVPDALRRRSWRRRRAGRWRTGAASRPSRPRRQLAPEVAVGVGRPELAARSEPAGVDLAAPDERVARGRRRCRRSRSRSRSRSSGGPAGGA